MTYQPIKKLYDANHKYYQHYTKRNNVNYHGQKCMAGKRNVPWDFTFESWIKWWEDTGHFHERGVNNHEYQMCRVNDTGPYSPDNVYCDLGSNNKRFFLDNNPEWIESRRQQGKSISEKRILNPKWHESRERLKKKYTARNVLTNEVITFIGSNWLVQNGYSIYMVKKSIETQTEYKGYVFLNKV